MKNAYSKIPVSVKFSPFILDKLKEVAVKEDRSISSLIRMSVASYLDELGKT